MPNTDQGLNNDTIIEQNNQELTVRLNVKILLQAPMILLEAMDNPHSTNAYETPTALFRMMLVQPSGNCADKKVYSDSENMKKMVFGKVLIQIMAKAGTKLYGEEAVQALTQ